MVCRPLTSQPRDVLIKTGPRLTMQIPWSHWPSEWLVWEWVWESQFQRVTRGFTHIHMWVPLEAAFLRTCRGALVNHTVNLKARFSTWTPTASVFLFNLHKWSYGNLNQRKKRSVPIFTPPRKLISLLCSSVFLLSSLWILKFYKFIIITLICFQDTVLLISWSISFPLSLFCCSFHTIEFLSL